MSEQESSNVVLPIKLDVLFMLENFGIDKNAISFSTVTIESYRYICVHDNTNTRLIVIDLNDITSVVKLEIACEFAIVNPTNKFIIALINKYSNVGLGANSTNCNTANVAKVIQIYCTELNRPIREFQIPLGDEIILMKWISPNVLGYVTKNYVYHWDVSSDNLPEKIFDRHVNLTNCQIINYRTDHTMKWCIMIGLSSQSNRVVGSMQLYSIDRGCSQYIDGHAACFIKYKINGNIEYSTLFCFIQKNYVNNNAKLQIVEVQNKPTANPILYNKRSIDVNIPAECFKDFPVAMQANEKHSMIYVMTMFGYIYLFDIETGTTLYINKISNDAIFATTPYDKNGGVICINKKGLVMLISIDENNILQYITNVMKNNDLALKIANRDVHFKNSDTLFIDKFNQLFQNKLYSEAAKISINSPNEILRSEKVFHQFLQIDQNDVTAQTRVGSGQVVNPAPLLQYFGLLLDSGKQLNHHESLVLCKRVLEQNKKHLLEKWLKEDKIMCSEELGDIVKQYDNILALSIFLRANKPDKVIGCFIETNQTCKIILYCKKINYKPNYINILGEIITFESRVESTIVLRHSTISIPSGGSSKTSENSLDFAKMLISECFEDEDYEKKLECMNSVVNVFVSMNKVKECTAFLLEVLKHNLPSECDLQTKLIEINLLSGELKVADAILSNKMFTYYDRFFIGQLCENHGLLERALQHYTDLYDIKRALIQTSQINQDFLVDYFNNLSAEDALECLKAMMSTNIRDNLKICIKICNEYYKQLTVESIIELFEHFKCYDGLYHFLGSIIFGRGVSYTDTDDFVCFKYLQSACETNQFIEVERICRDVQFNNPEKVKNYLKEIKLADQIPLIIICDRYDYVNDLVFYLYRNNLHNFLEIYVQKVNPSRLPEVIGCLLDVDCNEDCIKGLIMTVRIGQFPTDKLVEEIEKRNRLKLLVSWLELRVSEGSIDDAVHNAVAKIYIDTNNDSERFLRENQYYNSMVIGKYCEKRDPHLACIAYERGKCDQQYINVCFENNLFKMAARYLVRRCDETLWNKVLVMDVGVTDIDVVIRNRKQLIDQVIQIASSETHDTEEMSVTVKAFMIADLPNELIEILEKILLDNALFSNLRNLQNLLLLTAIKCDKKKLVSYIQRLDNYDVKDVAIICITNQLYEEAFSIYKKFNYNSLAVQVLIENIQNLDRACEFAEYCNESAVWSLLGKAQLRHNFIKGSIDSFVRADDPSAYVNVVETAQKTESWQDLVNYLQMAYKKIRGTYIESELIYAYAKTNRTADLEEFISVPNHADMLKIGDRCFDNHMYDAAKILYNNISHYAKLAIALAKLDEFRDAVDNARKANCTKTWKDICFICLDNSEYRLAQICGLNVVVHADELQCLIDYYEKEGRFDELIDLLETALGLERAHMGIFTELSILYAKYSPNKMKEHAELFWSRLNKPKVLKAADEAHLWSVSAFLYHKYEDYDNAVVTIINHPTESWRENHFKDIITKVTNYELYYKAIRFYFMYKPLLLNDLLMVLASRLDQTKLIILFKELNCLHLIKPYLFSVQTLNNISINEVLNDILIEEEDFEGLRNSIDINDNIDNIMLAQKLEKHELIEFRRLSAYLYKKSSRWVESIEICKHEKLYKDAMKFAAESKSPSIAEELLVWFLKKDLKDYFAALHFQCYDLLRPDIVLELSWRYNITDYAMPYIIQAVSEYVNKVDHVQENIEKLQEMVDKIHNSIEKQNMRINSSDQSQQLMLTSHVTSHLKEIHKNDLL